MHPAFDPGTFQDDVAYLVLAAPVELSPTVQTIDLAGDDEAAVWAPDTLVEVSGWGSTVYGGGTVNALRAATVPIVADSTCGSAVYYGTAFDPATMVCAGLLGGRGRHLQRRQWRAARVTAGGRGISPGRNHELGLPLRSSRTHPASTRASRRPRPVASETSVVAEVAELETHLRADAGGRSSAAEGGR